MNRTARSYGLGVIAGLAGSAVAARRGSVTQLEERCFRFFNDGPDALAGPIWLVMQSGSAGAVVVAAAAATRRGERRLAGELAIAGSFAWLGVKAIKPLVGRGRPSDCLDGVHVRGRPQRGLGYPSGHAAVVTTLVMVGAGGQAARSLGLGLVAVTSCARMYTGAHLPLDVVGGVAAGRLVAKLVTGIGGRVLRP